MESTELLRIFHSYAEPRRHSFRHHRHSAFEISYIAEGEGVYQVGERVFEIRAGDIFLYGTNEPHCITDITDGGKMHLINIQFEPRYIWSQTDGDAYLQTVYGRSARGENRIREEDPLYAPIREQILEAEREWTGGGIGAGDMVRSSILRILILLTRNETEAPSPRRQDEHRRALIGRSMDYICAHLTEPISLDELSRQANLSRTYYSTTFKELNGVTPWDYIHIKRVEKALSLLRHGDGNILDIALSCGFNNTANFNKIFRKVTGLSPREYRRAKN